jgi:hypothetical protein
MKRRRSLFLLLAGLGAISLLLLYMGLRLPRPSSPPPALPVATGAPDAESRSVLHARTDDPASFLEWVRAQLRADLGGRGARPNEAVVSFNNAGDYQRFLAAAEKAGLQVLGQVDALFSVRVGASSPEALARGIAGHGNTLIEVGGNPYVFTPQPPPAEARAAQRHYPFGDGMLGFIGVATDHQLWGRGVTIAVIDSGVAPDGTFGHGRVRHVDIGLGTLPGDGHGTAVAALAAGGTSDALGVAPSASILSIRVTDNTGVGDTFTLAQAIVTAVDSGARILNVSLGSYQSHPMLSHALDYAFNQGAVVVASAGNDQAGSLTWPAADPRVISVGAVDAIEQQVTFSNSGPQLQVSAPGYGVNTAWLDNQRVAFSGTSASAPIVSGSIAAVMSASPGLPAAEAWQVLAGHVSEAGPPGTDPDYGHGILNLGWAMARTDPTRVDTAVSSHYYNADSGTLEVVVQNRSAQGVAGLELSVDATTGSITSTLPWLKPGGTAVVSVPVDEQTLRSGAPLIFRSQLTNPAGLVDQVPSNNRKTSSLQAPAP